VVNLKLLKSKGTDEQERERKKVDHAGKEEDDEG